MTRKPTGWMTRLEVRQFEGLAPKENPMIFNRNRSPFQGRRRPNYEIKAAEHGDTTDVYIYDEIGLFGIDAGDFVRDLAEIETPTIDLHLNSPGGGVFSASAIANALRSHPARVITHIEGLAASMASIIALAGDEVLMWPNSFFMIHEPWSIVLGPAEDLRKEADLLDKMSNVLARTYAAKTGKSEAEMKELMAAETWFTADEALEIGFADEIEGESGEPADSFDLSVFKNTPVGLLDKKREQLTDRDLERALRDAGCSRSDAKAILAKGTQAIAQRDAGAGCLAETEAVTNLADRILRSA